MAYTFKGGIWPDDHKYTVNSKIEPIPEPEYVSVSLTQHVGVMCRPTVHVGDSVLVGQLIGEIPGGLGCPVHASVSGTVRKIEEVTTPSGGTSYNIVINNDGTHRVSPAVVPFGKKLSEASADELIAAIRDAGIAGMGGTAFPTYAKLSAARGKVERIIVNCCENEPFLCATHRQIVEHAEDIINGVKIMMVAAGVREAWIAVEAAKKDEIRRLESLIGESRLMSIKRVSSKYPQGSEKQLVYALCGREVRGGRTPIDTGNVVFNAETCAAVFSALSTGMPLIKRVVTVDGDCISHPKNLLVPIGTPVSHLIECCGPLCRPPKKVISGGPMMGTSLWDPESPVTKTTSGVLVLSDFFDRESSLPAVCIRCGRCVKACPVRLLPLKIAAFSAKGEFDRCDSLGAADCMECGSCSYVCPGGVPVVQLIGRAKSEILMKRRNARSGGDR